MDLDEYRKRGKEMVDYIADYLRDIRKRRVFPDVKPGYMRKMVPENAPENGEDWESIFSDVERVIMPGITHWQSPHMHAYFPALNSCPSLLGDMLADGINCLGFTWASSPACTELESLVMDWLGKMLGLPQAFLHSNEQTRGGGVIQTTASDATLVSLLAARSAVIRQLRAEDSNLSHNAICDRLVAYCSNQAHSSVEKAGLIGLVKMHFLEPDENFSLRGPAFETALARDKEDGLIPFFLCATLGTTGACTFDNLEELGKICEAEDVWMHVDAAYAGSAFICPEFRTYMAGIEHAQSFVFNPSKWLMVNFDCTAMWVRNSGALHQAFNVAPLYLKHENTGAAIDYMHWQTGLSKRFRALKLWFVIRSFGVKGLQEHIRKGVKLAEQFESFVAGDVKFEMPVKRVLGMVVFRLVGSDDLTEELLCQLNKGGKVHMVPASLNGIYVIRFTVTSQYTTIDDIRRDWLIISDVAEKILNRKHDGVKAADENDVILKSCGDSAATEKTISTIARYRCPISETKKSEFGLSLILSNVPTSPRFINGSFAAVFDNSEVLYEFAKYLSERNDFSNPTLIMTPRRRLKAKGKQFSLDADHLDKYQLVGRFKNQASLDSKIDAIFEYNEMFERENSNEEEELPVVNGEIQSPRSPLMRQKQVPPSIMSPTEDAHLVYNCEKCGHVFLISAPR